MSVLHLEDVRPDDVMRVGGKAVALARLAEVGLRVPPSICLCTDIYKRFVDSTGLGAVVTLELGRKSFADMRWEEIWDTALRIRNRFLREPVSDADRKLIESAVRDRFGDRLLVVRSSSPAEDSTAASFAGLHDSFVGVPAAEVVDHVKRVWASLWSDRALLYRRELGLRVTSSTMAILIQELVEGDASGVAFGVDPGDSTRCVVEAVHGLNQGLVDGVVAPDRWFLHRETGVVLGHDAPLERGRMQLHDGVLGLVTEAGIEEPPISASALAAVHDALARVGSLFGCPQDMEWTISGEDLTVLQARPVTTVAGEGDQRAWYLSLTRSLQNLQQLRPRIENELLPAMDREAAELAAVELSSLENDELAAEIERRRTVHDRWVDVYWQEFIPFAHGMRLFGQYYNDVVRPSDPYEFMDLLVSTPMLAVERNRRLESLAAWLRDDPELAEAASSGASNNPGFETELDEFLACFGSTTIGDTRVFSERYRLMKVLEAMSSRPARVVTRRPLVESFLDGVGADQRQTARELLELARVSYRLRDDDNMHMAAIKAEVLRAVDEGRRRIGEVAADFDLDGVVQSMRDPNAVVEPRSKDAAPEVDAGFRVRPRQLVGQPAGPGVAVGPARVIRGPEDLFEFHAGDVLVCDAVDPNMTFVVPLAAAVVERRGGMLIHGAIIAREYGLPCVTGVPDVQNQVATGDRLTVDGYLGIVTVG